MNRVERLIWQYREARSLRPARIDAGHVIKNIKVYLRSLGFYLPRDDRHGISWGFGYDAAPVATFSNDWPRSPPRSAKRWRPLAEATADE
ncbi:MAG: hypothetical protein V6Z86_06270 [Hyphomicrobiales bacterium]